MCTCKETSLLSCPEHCPPPGSWAETAMLMASIPSDDDFDWDAWKDEMKDSTLEQI